MVSLTETSKVIAADLRRAELSISQATRDTAQLIISTVEATMAHGISPAMTHMTVKASVNALSSLVDSQAHVALRAHTSIEKIGRRLGMDETSWGELLPKPTSEEVEGALATA